MGLCLKIQICKAFVKPEAIERTTSPRETYKAKRKEASRVYKGYETSKRN